MRGLGRSEKTVEVGLKMVTVIGPEIQFCGRVRIQAQPTTNEVNKLNSAWKQVSTLERSIPMRTCSYVYCLRLHVEQHCTKMWGTVGGGRMIFLGGTGGSRLIRTWIIRSPVEITCRSRSLMCWSACWIQKKKILNLKEFFLVQLYYFFELSWRCP